MPTAARLSAAITFAIVGYFIYRAMLPSYGDDRITSYIMLLCILTGVWAGCVLCGKHAHGLISGLGTGYAAVVAQAFWIFFILAFLDMLGQALKRRYDGPMEAVVDMFTLSLELLAQLGTPSLATTLFVGAAAGGIFAGIMGKKFPR